MKTIHTRSLSVRRGLRSDVRHVHFPFRYHLKYSHSVTVTKAAEKIKNIESAIGVFEKWLEENGGGSSNKNAKAESSDKVDTVPGLGFKDKEAAKKTLK